MPPGFIFFICGCCILLFTIINLSIGPIISGTVGYDSLNNLGYWGTANCAILKDNYNANKGNYEEEEKKYRYQWGIDCCERKKAMYNMEYTAFIFDVVIGFVCGLLGFLHYLGLKKDFVEKTGLIGLICGCVGFILTFVYVIFNGLVYTNYYDSIIYKRNGDGAFAELEGNDYKSLYFDKKGNYHAFYAKYSDLINKQYNYNKDLIDSYESDEVGGCTSNPSNCDDDNDGICRIGKMQIPGTTKDCQYLYIPKSQLNDEIKNKNKSDRFLTSLIVSLIVCFANLGLAFFGFLMAKSGEFEA